MTRLSSQLRCSKSAARRSQRSRRKAFIVCCFIHLQYLKKTCEIFSAVYERLRAILEDADTIDTRTQYAIEIAMHVRKEGFKAYPAVIESLDLIDEEDQISHLVELAPEDGKAIDPETPLNYYKFDPDFEANEESYEEIRKQVIGDAGDDDSDDEEEADEEADENSAAAARMFFVVVVEKVFWYSQCI